LGSSSDRQILPKDIPVPSQNPISLTTINTISQLNDVINIMQRMRQSPFHSNLQYDGRILATPKTFSQKNLYRDSEYYFSVWQSFV
jgi:hypothetical protein